VSLAYEILNALAPAPVLGHVEHTMLGKARRRHQRHGDRPGER
jgi:hypothetical protein